MGGVPRGVCIQRSGEACLVLLQVHNLWRTTASFEWFKVIACPSQVSTGPYDLSPLRPWRLCAFAL
jgi:hypothetical protein